MMSIEIKHFIRTKCFVFYVLCFCFVFRKKEKKKFLFFFFNRFYTQKKRENERFGFLFVCFSSLLASPFRSRFTHVITTKKKGREEGRGRRRRRKKGENNRKREMQSQSEVPIDKRCSCPLRVTHNGVMIYGCFPSRIFS